MLSTASVYANIFPCGSVSSVNQVWVSAPRDTHGVRSHLERHLDLLRPPQPQALCWRGVYCTYAFTKRGIPQSRLFSYVFKSGSVPAGCCMLLPFFVCTLFATRKPHSQGVRVFVFCAQWTVRSVTCDDKLRYVTVWSAPRLLCLILVAAFRQSIFCLDVSASCEMRSYRESTDVSLNLLSVRRTSIDSELKNSRYLVRKVKLWQSL